MTHEVKIISDSLCNFIIFDLVDVIEFSSHKDRSVNDIFFFKPMQCGALTQII